MDRVEAGVYDASIRTQTGFHVVTVKVDVAFTDLRAAEAFLAEMESLEAAEGPATLEYQAPTAEGKEQGE